MRSAHTKVRIEKYLIEEIKEIAAASGVKSATTLANWLIAVGLDDLRSGRLQIRRGMMLERVEEAPQAEQQPTIRRQRARGGRTKRSAAVQDSPATNQRTIEPQQSDATEARRSRGHQSTDHRTAAVDHHPTTSPAHIEPQQSGNTHAPTSGPSNRSSREPSLPRATEAALQPPHGRTATASKNTAATLPDDLTEEEREYLKHPGIVRNPETGKPMVRLDPPIGINEVLWEIRRENVIGGDIVDGDTIEAITVHGLRWETPAE